MKQIDIAELDFDAVKENLKAFLRTQSEFNSYDFEGSALTILLDVLAYNTTYNASYLNMAVNESFIDSAIKRSSLVSLSKSLGYTASSRRASTAKLRIQISPLVTDTETSFVIPKGTIFSGVVDTTQYQFTTLTDYTAVKNAGVFVFDDVIVYEGSLLSTTYIVEDNSKFVIPAAAVDLTTLSVLVRESESSSKVERFVKAEDLFKVKPTDAVFFIKQRGDLFYEIYFGTGGIGRPVVNGNAVKLEYLECLGDAANAANLFVYQSGIDVEGLTFDITTVQGGFGGTAEEDVESIRFNAPRAHITQNRAVTTGDYENLLLSNYPIIESIHAWGGQDNIPKVFGKVFICAKPKGALRFTHPEKAAMQKSLINGRGVVSISPVVVDPLYMNIELSCNVYYNLNTTIWTGGQLQSFIKNKIIEYGTTLNKFDSVFRYSKISALIDSVDTAGIVSNAVSFRIRVPVEPLYDSNSQYTLIVGNPISPGTFYTTRFYISDFADRVYVRDNSAGALHLYSEDVDGNATFQRAVGTVNYAVGTWDIPALTVNKLHDVVLEFVFTPKSNDVVSNRNILVSMPASDITVNMISDNIANGSETGGETFVFSNIR